MLILNYFVIYLKKIGTRTDAEIQLLKEDCHKNKKLGQVLISYFYDTKFIFAEIVVCDSISFYSFKFISKFNFGYAYMSSNRSTCVRIQVERKKLKYICLA